MNRILAIDPGTFTGWASDLNGVRESGCEVFQPRRGQSPGWRFIKFNVWLYAWSAKKIQLIVYEKPIRLHQSWAAAEVALGLGTRIQEFAARENIPCKVVTNNQVKQFATGNGRAEKEQMVRAAQVLKRGVLDHNEADALWLLEYAKARLVQKAAS